MHVSYYWPLPHAEGPKKKTDPHAEELSHWKRELQFLILGAVFIDRLIKGKSMAEILGSAVANEAVNKVSSILSGNPRDHESNEDKAERLEMAVLKIQSVVAVSEDWQIVHQPLLNWKANLKRVGKEGDDFLHAYKRRVAKCKRNEETARQDSIPKRITRAVKRFMPFARREDNLSDAMLRRFERLAHGADEFFRYVQFGGRPKSLMFLKIPTKSLLAGRTLEVSLKKGSQDALLLLQPCDSKAGNQKEIILFFSYDDTMRWEKNVKLYVIFHLLEHIDIMGIVLTCLELLPPQFGAASVTIKEFVREMLLQETCHFNPSVVSVWCGATAWKCHHSSIEPCTDEGCSNGKLQLPLPIIRIDAVCFALPENYSSTPANNSLPLKLTCHITPHLVPKKYSDHYEQIEPQKLQELLPKVTSASSFKNARALAGKGHWWCPHSSTYMSVEPEYSVPPPTLKQLYVMKNSERPVQCSQK